ncbi:MAG: hypothetical protein IKE66_02390 [Hyphomicrobium sp.]|nr:hypothetical protein [Hyphomicrobium sp.]
MHYDLVSRALAYTSCLTAMSLFATSMAIAAINVGKSPPSLACSTKTCGYAPQKVGMSEFGGLTSKAHVDAVAAVLWSQKI